MIETYCGLAVITRYIRDQTILSAILSFGSMPACSRVGCTCCITVKMSTTINKESDDDDKPNLFSSSSSDDVNHPDPGSARPPSSSRASVSSVFRPPLFPLSVRCALCGQVGSYQCCGRCKEAHYCCKTHQKKHWKRHHKNHCMPKCACCNVGGASKMCARCQCTYYCSKECQRHHWKQQLRYHCPHMWEVD